MNTSELATSLRAIVSTLHKGFRKQVSEVNSYSLTEKDTIGHLLRNESLLATELAALTRVKTQSMSQILKKLEEQGVIDRTQSETDKRKVHISISPAGKEMVEKMMRDRDERFKNIMETSLSAAERQLLVKALPVLQKLVEHK